MIRRFRAKLRFMREHRWTGPRMSDYLDGDLRPDERARLEDHVHWCPECRRMLESLRRTIDGLTGLRGPAPGNVAPGVIERLRRES